MWVQEIKLKLPDLDQILYLLNHFAGLCLTVFDRIFLETRVTLNQEEAKAILNQT